MTPENEQNSGRTLVELMGSDGAEKCWCRACEPAKMFETRFVVCPVCGDKRCVHAHNHLAPCAKADLFGHNAWVERMALRADPGKAEHMPQLGAVIALGAWDVKAPEARIAGRGSSE